MNLSVTFNGEVFLRIIPEDELDKRLLELASNGREVRSIKQTPEGGLVLELAKSEEKK